MNRRVVLLGGAAVLVAALLAWFLSRPSEEQRVRATLERFVKVVAVKDGDNIIARTGRIRSGMKEIVDDLVHVEVPDLSLRVTGREALADGATKAGLVYSSADAELVGLEIKIDEPATTAKVDGTVLVAGVRGGERRIDKRRVHFLLRKDGDWRITTIDVAPAE